ncbi:hypothetical protein RFI_30067 [Reticulomyxa filosa]|uniref:Uncharacterized protein n=1 Tax=Reticulomyxa filosa TaxID=46433 RepID=X6M147_RETFI|nr:hypothetical protein RFI_30067 [Reticulomyxa filosa]|eukprot:ETO07326.1 hypothetical protein RFI_30067 [Reticulomyxa filosa]
MEVALQCGDKRWVITIEPDDNFELFQFQVFSLTEISPETQEFRVSSMASMIYNEKIDLKSVKGTDIIHVRKKNPNMAAFPTIGNVALPQVVVERPERIQSFMAHVYPSLSQMEKYEDPLLQKKAREMIPVAMLEKRASRNANLSPYTVTYMIFFHKKEIYIYMYTCIYVYAYMYIYTHIHIYNNNTEAIDNGCSFLSPKDQFVKELLHWFKFEWFTWVDALKCKFCGGKSKAAGMMQPTSDDLKYGAS